MTAPLPPARRPRLAFWLLLVSLPAWFLLALGLLCETGIRVYLATRPPAVESSGKDYPPYYYRPGARVYSHTTAFYMPTVTINSLGLRGPEIPLRKPAGVKRILILGDSVVYGSLATEGQTLAARMEASLNAAEAGRWQVINAGVGSYDLWAYPAYLREKGLAFEPDIVVVGICLNDNVSRKDFAAVTGRTEAPTATLRWKVRSWLFSSKALEWLNYLVNVRRPAKGQSIATRKPVTLELRRRLEELLGGDQPSLGALLRFLDDYRYYPYIAVDMLTTMLDLKRWVLGREALQDLRGQCRSRGIKLIGFAFPVQFELYPGYRHPEPHRTIAEGFRRLGIPFFDAPGAFAGVPAADELFPKRYDLMHPSGPFYERLGRELLRDLSARGWVAGRY